MSDKNKPLRTSKSKQASTAKLVKEVEANSQSAEDRPSHAAMTDEEALALGVSSLRKVRKAISQKDQWAIMSMISYVSFKQKIDEETVRSILLSHLDIEEMIDIPVSHYDRAISFLVDFDISKILN